MTWGQGQYKHTGPLEIGLPGASGAALSGKIVPCQGAKGGRP